MIGLYTCTLRNILKLKYLVWWKVSDDRAAKRTCQTKAQTQLVQTVELKIRRVQAFGQHFKLKVANKQTQRHQDHGEIEELREDVCLGNPSASVAYGGNERIDVI